MRRLLWVVLRAMLRLLFLVCFRVRVFGQHNVPETGGALIASNHQSYLDPLVIGIGLHRSVAYMARHTLFRNRAFGGLMRGVNAFPVQRGGADIDAVRRAVNLLEAGWCLALFPEGTRTRDGRIGSLRPGALMIATRASAPIVPALIEGAFVAWPRGRWPRPHPVSVRFGRPISAEEQKRLTRAELARRLEDEMAALKSRPRH